MILSSRILSDRSSKSSFKFSKVFVDVIKRVTSLLFSLDSGTLLSESILTFISVVPKGTVQLIEATA